MLSEAQRADRMNRMILLRESGETLEAICARFGITRERARQLLARHRVGCPSREPDVDPLVILRAIRRPQVRSFHEVAGIVGVDPIRVRRVVMRLGMTAAVKRLFVWRRDRAFVDRFAELARSLGHTPTVDECRAVGLWQGSIQKYIGGMQAIARRAGLAPNPSGCRRRGAA